MVREAGGDHMKPAKEVECCCASDPRVWVQYHRGTIVLGAWVRIFARGKKFVEELEAWADTPEGAKRTFAEIVKRHAARYTASR